MSPWAAFATAGIFLVAPWALMPSRRDRELHGVLRLLWWLNFLYCDWWHRFEVVGRSTLPESGPALLISNHTCCIDHMLLQASTRTRLLGFLIAKELYDYWLFRPFCAAARCIPVRRDGRDVSATRTAVRAVQEGRVVPIFPEGRIWPTSGQTFGPGKPGVAFVALKAGAPVVPAYIWGTPPTNKIVRSYFTPSRARICFGPPIDLSDLVGEDADLRETLEEVTERLMAAIRRLRDLVNPQPDESGPDAGRADSEDPADVRRTGVGA